MFNDLIINGQLVFPSVEEAREKHEEIFLRDALDKLIEAIEANENDFDLHIDTPKTVVRRLRAAGYKVTHEAYVTISGTRHYYKVSGWHPDELEAPTVDSVDDEVQSCTK